MSDWQERITRETAPAIWAEHELRYRLIAPLVGTSSLWVDLGCGNGVAAAVAFRDRRPSRAVLVDMDAVAVAEAARELGLPDAQQLTGDLTNPKALEQIGSELLGTEGERIVSCFEVVEHLSTFVPLLKWSGELARDGAATFVFSVPNDAFWSIENPFHAARWSEGAFEELRRLVPPEHTLLNQVALVGSAMVGWGGTSERHTVSVDVGGSRTVASHFIVAFGPHHEKLTSGAVARAAAQHEQRRWERQRESNLAYAEAVVDSQQRELKAFVAERDEWRAYINELEHALGRPLSGVEPGHDDP